MTAMGVSGIADCQHARCPAQGSAPERATMGGNEKVVRATPNRL